jgi:hypothetical protein
MEELKLLLCFLNHSCVLRGKKYDEAKVQWWYLVVHMVEMILKFLQNISHYCTNIFAFHMHMFIIHVLSFNKLNTIIHSNIIFMVIDITSICTSKYIVTNFGNKIIIHCIVIWYYRKFTHKLNIEFTIEVCASLYYWKHLPKL